MFTYFMGSSTNLWMFHVAKRDEKGQYIHDNTTGSYVKYKAVAIYFLSNDMKITCTVKVIVFQDWSG